MADEMVRRAQRFVNSYNVDGIPKVEEDGITGWATMYALTRVLQHELGITALSDSFGPATQSALQSRYPNVDSSVQHAAILRVLQSGLYCKGYDGGDIDGTYNDRVATDVRRLKQDMGVAGAFPTEGVTPKVFKAILTMDAYVVIRGGTAQIRSIQQWMNGEYVHRRNFFIMPCDGNFSRDVQKNLLYAVQYQIGMSDDVANGVFGPGTQDGIKRNPIGVGSTGTWVQLFSAAMIFNRRSGVAFTASFDSSLATRVREFQDFVKLPTTGNGDFQTWASLLVSTGDKTRAGTACDCVTAITVARATTLRTAGYQIVGRYLSNVANSSLNKKIQPGELATISNNGLRVFPIYQTYGGAASYFSASQGISDAFAAIDRARSYGFKPGTRIYFAVDFDALDYQVTDHILPHFKALAATMFEHGREYRVGIYGPRNVCSRVAAAGHSTASFVSDMSTGFSGNLGYPLPADWAYDQIATKSLGTGDGYIQIDNNIASGLDSGQNAFNPPANLTDLDVSFDPAQRDAMLADVRAYFESIGIPEDGGPGHKAFTLKTTGEAFDITMSADWLLTDLARTLRIRKSLVMCPLLWELRQQNIDEPFADEAVRDHYEGTGVSPSTDSSTGLAQIRAATAISSRNYCIAQQIIGGTSMDPASEADLWPVWQRLNEDDVYNISTIPLVHIWGANDIGQRRPGLDYSEAESQAVLARYVGTGDEPDNIGRQQLGLFRVFEKYNAPMRAR